MSGLTRVVREETHGFHPRLLLARLLTALLPVHAGSRLRTAVLRRVAGFRIGRGTLFTGMPTITGPRHLSRHLTVGSLCWFNIRCTLDLSAEIEIGDQAYFGHDVMLLTSSHEVGPVERRAAEVYAKPIHVGAGAWLGARCVVLPGITIGEGAIVGAGAVVTKDVPPNTVVGGIPARVIRELEPNEEARASA
jgi:maltose O-acetyltransferase